MNERAGLGRDHLSLAVETVLFLALFVPAVLILSSLLLPQPLQFSAVALATIAAQVVMILGVYGLLRRRGERMQDIGWQCSSWKRELGLGVLLFVPFYVFAASIERLLLEAGFSAPDQLPEFLIPQGGWDYVLGIAFLVAVAAGEESVFRGYLLRRVRQVSGSPVAAVVVSTVAFAAGHGYQGSAGVLTVGAMGLIFALIYLWRGSLLAPMALHLLQDFVGIFVLPLLVSA